MVTGAAGFIGFQLTRTLLNNGHVVVGLDNINDYYDVNLKYARLKNLGIESNLAKIENVYVSSERYQKFKFIRLSLENRKELPRIFKNGNFDVVCNLAAQAGVRYSLENPETYVDSNIVGFLNILECCRKFKVKHLVYASSSSVYGNNKKIPFETTDPVDHPVSLYAASKKCNELMAHTYSHLYGLRTTGLRFFTVYGPWGRPDMAMFIFIKAILNHKPINVFNAGKMERDFTYIDDIIEGVTRIIEDRYTNDFDSKKLYKLYNIGNSKSVNLLEFIEKLEEKLGRKAIKNMMEMQPGDVEKTWANVETLQRDYNYKPNTPIENGISATVDWYIDFYNQKS